MKRKPYTATTPETLPPGIKDTDLKPVSWKAKTGHLTREDWDRLEQEHALPYASTLEFYFTERFGWCLSTLHIRKASSRQRARGVTTDRTYGITVNTEEQVRIGIGPHVKRQITVYLKAANLKRLEKYCALYRKGLESANDTRDRISTSRARSAGRRDPWNW